LFGSHNPFINLSSKLFQQEKKERVERDTEKVPRTRGTSAEPDTVAPRSFLCNNPENASHDVEYVLEKENIPNLSSSWRDPPEFPISMVHTVELGGALVLRMISRSGEAPQASILVMNLPPDRSKSLFGG
jgi:hypothetical protein